MAIESPRSDILLPVAIYDRLQPYNSMLLLSQIKLFVSDIRYKQTVTFGPFYSSGLFINYDTNIWGERLARVGFPRVN